MNTFLTTNELALLNRLNYDVIIAYRDATVTPENRADCESIRRGIRDRLKPYQGQSLLASSVLNKVLVVVETQQSQIKGLVEAAYKALPQSSCYCGISAATKAAYPNTSLCKYCQLNKTLSTLTADCLKLEEKREAVIKAAKSCCEYYDFASAQELAAAVEALEGV